MLFLLLAFSSVAEQEKFEFIYEKYKRLLYHKAYGILHDQMLAEDAVSEALLRVYKNLHKIEDPASPRTAAFVVTIVRNTALTMLSKRQAQPADPIDEMEQDSFDLESAVLADLSSSDIYGVVDQLGDDLRSVFLLKFAYDLPHKEIGRLLGISENNVTVRLHRAKKKLSQALAKEGFAYGRE